MTAVSTLPLAEVARDAAPARGRKVLHFIPGIAGGGAENFLRLLVHAMRESAWQTVIVVVRVHPHEALADELRAAGAVIHDLNETSLLNARVWLGARRLMASERPDVVQTWMHHADFIGSVAAFSCGVSNIVWGVRGAEIFRNAHDTETKLRFFKLALRLASKFMPRAIITNSTAALTSHRAMGYPLSKFKLIPNGVNAARFAPNEPLGRATRSQLGIASDAPVVGFVGRFNEAKDLVTFFRAARMVQQQRTGVKFVLVGGTAEDLYPEAKLDFEALPKRDEVHFVPFGIGTEKFYPAFSLFTLPSRTEAFPNVVLEAMATGVPCVTTDAGDCATMLHDIGTIVPVGDADALAKGWITTLDLPAAERAQLAFNSRERAINNYSVERAARSFMEVYESLIS